MAETPLRTVPDLTGMLKHAGHVLETQLTAALAEIGLSPRMQCVLVYALEEERTQIQLAELAYLDKTTMVGTVDALEKAGFAERKPSETDRRARIIAVTPEGVKAAVDGQRIVDQVHGDALAALAASQRKLFADSLAELVGGQLATPVEAQPVRRTRQRS
ncbi:MarR family transcriptional regulator [Streptomyces sp. SID13031]|uniref:MarR family winged helix-turn-helix transcriptional regulator n=1 Tax=Streptomyces sp. SID13031 TaxID=2706046 RepID=UPI0013CDB1DE|nr:MarR family transcriptional regulator [Streptomyces sp. SID13031]NEA34630.1 MarR family transcriptional regulator [Streptomyces sp. SID13031]